MNIKDLGYNDKIEESRIEQNLDRFEVGRVIAEHKERYIVRTADGVFESEITGNMRFTAKGRVDFPAVGDWVALMTFGPDQAVIHNILPRSSVIRRQAVGQFGEAQIIATNIDFALIVQSVDRDFNINRMERYLTICHSEGISPVIVLTKIDLITDEKITEIHNHIMARIKDVPVISISNLSQDGFEAIRNILEKGKTYCLLGSSGVGKSTLLNNLSGDDIMKTDAISQSTNKGRHTTSHRELFILENGGILIDNPGMREVGITDATYGLETTFDNILDLSEECRFKDCSHTNETGCAVLDAVETGELDRNSYENYIKLQREKAHFESTIAERKKTDKDFGKMLKNYKKGKTKNS
ncbi:ribosome small subunit-dependent GTPase A [Bacteroidota bacterium]